MPMPVAIHKISSKNSLLSAWSHIRKTRKARLEKNAGIDGKSINEFSSNLKNNINDLSLEIKEGYKFSPLLAYLIPKPNGKVRIICVPTIKDRIVQRAILEFLSEGDKCGMKNNVSYGFIKGRRVEQAVTRAKRMRSRFRWIYKTDITSFFDQVDRELLLQKIKKIVKHRSLHDILFNVACCEINEDRESRKISIRKQGINKGRGVRQGMPLSPFFANLFLKNFDFAIEKYGVKMIRYADDLILFSKSKQGCIELHELCKNELKKVGLEIPDIDVESKTLIYEPKETAEFLGVGIVYHGKDYRIEITKEQIKRIKEVLFRYSNLKYLVDENITINKFGQKLEGSFAGYAGAYSYCENFDNFNDLMDKWKLDIIKRLFIDGLGIDLSKLNDTQRKFLTL